MTVYLVFTTMLDQTSFVGAYQTRELADETIRILKGIVGKEYWVIEEPVVTKLYEVDPWLGANRNT
jgi:hypothetical protein